MDTEHDRSRPAAARAAHAGPARSEPPHTATSALAASLSALATRLHSRADHRLHEARLSPSATSAAVIAPYFPAELAATLAAFAGVTLVWSGPGGARGALRVARLADLAMGWRPAREFPGLDAAAAAAVCIDQGDGDARGVLVADDRGRTSYVWAPVDGPSLFVATTLHGYLERCLMRAARRGWPLATGDLGIARPLPMEAAAHARARVHCRAARRRTLDEVRARRLAALPKHAQLVEALGVTPDALAAAVLAMDPRHPPKALSQVLRGRRSAPRTVGELRRWALADDEPEPWVEVTLAIERAPGGVSALGPRETWLALAAAPGGDVALAEAERARLADDAHAEPDPDDAALLTRRQAGEVTLTVPAARAPRGCADGACWTAVLPPAPRTRPC